VVRFNHQLNRRDAVRTLAAGTIGAATASSWVESLIALAQREAHAHSAVAVMSAQTWKPRVLTAAQNDAVVTLTELIIPQTDTPGAKAVGVNRFIDRVLYEANAADRDKFLRGLAWVDVRSKTLSGKGFVAATPAEQTALLTRLADETNKHEGDRPGVDFFRAIKAMTISGYYTTQVGLQQELGDDGRLAMEEFVGCTHPEHQG
jgi:hypothetical protein